MQTRPLTAGSLVEARRSYSPPQIPATQASEAHTVAKSRDLLDKLRRRRSQQLSLTGRGCQSDLNERWEEMHAWCGYLATNLEGACSRIEQLADERREFVSHRHEQETTIRQLEYRASNKNVARLEQTIEQLQATMPVQHAGFAGGLLSTQRSAASTTNAFDLNN